MLSVKLRQPSLHNGQRGGDDRRDFCKSVESTGWEELLWMVVPGSEGDVETGGVDGA